MASFRWKYLAYVTGAFFKPCPTRLTQTQERHKIIRLLRCGLFIAPYKRWGNVFFCKNKKQNPQAYESDMWMLPIFCSIAISTLSLWQLLLLWQLLYCYYYSITIMTMYILNLFPITLLLLLFPLFEILYFYSYFLFLYFLLPYYLLLYYLLQLPMYCALYCYWYASTFHSQACCYLSPSSVNGQHIEFLDIFYIVPCLAGSILLFISFGPTTHSKREKKCFLTFASCTVCW